MQETQKKNNPLLGKTTKKLCTCYSPFQDKEHGKQLRVHNYCLKPGGGLGCRCTVCGDLKEAKNEVL